MGEDSVMHDDEFSRIVWERQRFILCFMLYCVLSRRAIMLSLLRLTVTIILFISSCAIFD